MATCLHLVCIQPVHVRNSLTLFEGSYDSSIRLWKLEDKARSFSALVDIPASGYVNSLQLLTPPRDSALGHTWGHPPEPETLPEENEAPTTEGKEKPKFPLGRTRDEVLLVAALAQEPRLGRWMRVHGQGEKNTALVVALPRGDLVAGARGG